MPNLPCLESSILCWMSSRQGLPHSQICWHTEHSTWQRQIHLSFFWRVHQWNEEGNANIHSTNLQTSHKAQWIFITHPNPSSWQTLSEISPLQSSAHARCHDFPILACTSPSVLREPLSNLTGEQNMQKHFRQVVNHFPPPPQSNRNVISRDLVLPLESTKKKLKCFTEITNPAPPGCCVTTGRKCCFYFL